MSVRHRSELDCRACGACCLGGYDDGYGWADCTVEDVLRMSRYARSKLVTIRLGLDYSEARHAATPVIMTEEFGTVCAFLRGTPGRRCSCAIYSTRPEVCRTLEPGSRRCLESRKEISLGVKAA